jgi:hypothetical protein
MTFDVNRLKTQLVDRHHSVFVLQDMPSPVWINGGYALVAKQYNVPGLDEVRVAQFIADQDKRFFSFYEYREETQILRCSLFSPALPFPHSVDPNIYIFDIDGTLADGSHRQHFVRNKPKNWPAYQAAIMDDKPHKHVIDVLKALRFFGHKILIASGRGEQEREDTINWLEWHAGLRELRDFDQLYMRKEKDYRADDIIKEEILAVIRQQHGEPTMVFDDRDRVVEMWRHNGVPCAQVAEGDF